MFPAFVNSFGDQTTAVFINLIGTVLGAFFTSFFGVFANTILKPILDSLAAALGLGA